MGGGVGDEMRSRRRLERSAWELGNVGCLIFDG